jgi:gluconate 5-dehydrogenase
MIKRGRGGKIINIASLTSEVARASTGPYTTAKGGIKLLTRVMTAEWAEQGDTDEGARSRLHCHRDE